MPYWKILLLSMAAVYVAGALMTLGRLGRHIWTESLVHPAIWRNGETWLAALVRALFWPLLVVLHPASLTGTGSWADELMDGAALAKKHARRARAQRRCSAVVRYRQPDLPVIEGGEFFIRAADLERYVAARAASEPAGTSADSFYGRRLSWLRERNDLQSAPVDLPETWEGIERWIEDLLRDGKARVRCVRCTILLTREELVGESDEGQPGWNYDRLLCPKEPRTR